MDQICCPECGDDIAFSKLRIGGAFKETWFDRFPFDCLAECSKCDIGVTRDGVLLTKADDKGTVVNAGIGRGGRIIFVAGPGDSERNLEILCALEEEGQRIRQRRDLSNPQDRETIWNLKRAKRRFRNWCRKDDKTFLVIEDERRRKLIDSILSEGSDEEPDYAEIFNDLTSNHVLVQRAAEYEANRLQESPLLLAEFPKPVQALFHELIEAHRWGLDRAAVVLCRSLLEEMARRASSRTSAHILPRERESWLVAALRVLHDEGILSDQEYDAANKIREEGNRAVHESSESVSAWEVIELTVDLLRNLSNRCQLSDWGHAS